MESNLSTAQSTKNQQPPKSPLLSTGQFAKLACTTKRTIALYDTMCLLKPTKMEGTYRYYKERQILDYQRIHLLTTIGISLKDIQLLLQKEKSISKLFEKKSSEILDEINLLKFNLESIYQITQNIKTTKTMVDPRIKSMKPFRVLYINKKGSYSRIGKYCDELLSKFENAQNNYTTMTIFLQQDYRPNESEMKICVIPKGNLVVKKEFKGIVKEEIFRPGKVISYVHRGSGDLLSLFWKELEKFCRLNKIKVRNEPDFEIYHVVSKKPWEQRFEIFLPVE